MNLKKALNLAIAALEEQSKPLAFDANMHDLYDQDYPLACSAAKQRKHLREAITTLELELELITPHREPLRKAMIPLEDTLSSKTPTHLS